MGIPRDYSRYGKKAQYKIVEDVFASLASEVILKVVHSPMVAIEVSQLNDFGGDGDL